MGELSLTTKKEPVIIKEDKNWYKSYCHRCPYLVREPSFDMNTDTEGEKSKVAVRCVRPVKEGCLAHAPLVSAFLMREMYLEAAKKITAKTEPVLIPVGAATLKRRSKMIKRRR